MKKEIYGWIGVFCILALWMGGAVYFMIEVKEALLGSTLVMRRLAERTALVGEELSRVNSRLQRIESLVPPKTVVMTKDGCPRAECLARLLLATADLRRSFTRGAMSRDAVCAIKPLLTELRDADIDDDLKIVERFNPRIGYPELIAALKDIKSGLHSIGAGPMAKYLSRWIAIKNHNDEIWRKFERLESLAMTGAWKEALELAADTTLSSVPGLQVWVQDLESIQKVDTSLSRIYDRLIERVNRTPEGI